MGAILPTTVQKWPRKRRKFAARKYLTPIALLILFCLAYKYADPMLLITFNFRLLLDNPPLKKVLPSKPTYSSSHIRKVPDSLFLWGYNQPLQLECSTCALVFNSGHLIGSNSGSKIDAHQCVVRINDAPVGREFASDVGSRTTVRVVRSEAGRNIVQKKSSGQIIIHDEIVIFVTIAGADVIKHYPKNSFFMTSKKFFKPLFFDEIERTFQMMNEKVNISKPEKPVPSTGFLSISMMLNFCDSLTIYGMAPPDFCERNPDSDIPYHYYDRDREQRTECGFYKQTFEKAKDVRSTGGHLYITEHMIYDRWRQTRNITFDTPAWDKR